LETSSRLTSVATTASYPQSLLLSPKVQISTPLRQELPSSESDVILGLAAGKFVNGVYDRADDASWSEMSTARQDLKRV
jgi:hypothetical protein